MKMTWKVRQRVQTFQHFSTCKTQIQFSVLEESPNYLISMNVRSMNESEDVPTVFLRISYPDGYPDKPLDIEYDDEENDSYEAEDLSELDGVLKNVVSKNIFEMTFFSKLNDILNFV